MFQKLFDALSIRSFDFSARMFWCILASLVLALSFQYKLTQKVSNVLYATYVSTAFVYNIIMINEWISNQLNSKYILQ